MGGENRKTILLVEDEVIIAVAEKMSLEKYRYNVITAASGEKAIGLFRNNAEVDLVLMDVDLGEGMDGPETATAILKERAIPIVFLSSHTEPEIVEKTERITSYGYVVKNSGITVLDASIKMAFRLFEAKRSNEEIETKQKAMITNISDVIGIIGPEGVVQYESPNIEQWFGWRPEDLIGTDGWQTIHPDDIERVKRELLLLLETDGAKKNVEFGFRCKDGEYKSVELTATNLVKDPVIHGVLLNYHDITERKRSENALLASELRYLSLFSGMTEGFALHEIVLDDGGKPCDYRFLDVNPAFERLTGLKREAILGRGQREVLPDEDRFWFDAYSRVALTGEPVHIEHYSPMLGKYYGVFAYRPAANQFAVVFSDISERRRAEEELKKYRLLLESSIESPKDMIILSIDREYRYLYFNTSHRNVMRAAYGMDVAIGMSILDCITNDGDRRKARVNYDRALAGESHITVEEYGDLNRLYYETRYNPITNERGETIGATAFSSDITERKRTEAELVANHELLGSFISHSPIYAFIKEVTPEASTVLYASDNYAEMVGVPGREMRGKTMPELFPPEFARKILRDDREAVSGESVLELEEELGGKSYKTVKFPIRQGDRILLAGYSIDVTRQREADASLRESEEKFRLLHEYAGIGIGYYGMDGTILSYNRVAAGNMGGLPKDFTGKSLPEIFPPGEAETYLARIRDAALSETPVVYEDSLTLPSGARRFLSTLTRIMDREGNVSGVQIISQDVSALKSVEPGRADLPFAEYIGSLARELMAVFPNGDSVRLETSVEDIRLDARTLLPLGMIVNELIANAMRYSFPSGRPGSITLCASRAEGAFRVAVSEDGAGIPESAGPGNPPGMDMSLVRGLVARIDGRLRIERSAGTRYVVEFGGKDPRP